MQPKPTDGDDPLLQRLQATARVERRAGHGCEVVWHGWGGGSGGEHAVIVLLHGGHGSWRHWVRNIDALAQRHRVLVPDLPGFGESADLAVEPHAADRLPKLVSTVVASLDALVGAGTAVGLVGFSFGGLVAAHVAAERRHVSRLALLGAAGHGSKRRQLQAMRDWRAAEAAGQHAEMLAALRQNLQVLMLHDATRIDALALAVHEASCRQTRFRSKAVSLRGSLRQALSAFDAPVLAAWGRHDVTATPEVAGPLLCDGHAARSWTIVEDAGHWLQYEQADATNALLGAWFGPGGRIP